VAQNGLGYTATITEAAVLSLQTGVDLNSGGFERAPNPKTGFAYEHLVEGYSQHMFNESLLDR